MTPPEGVTYRVGERRYEALVDGQVVGVSTWHDDGSVRTLPHTQVEEHLEGHGIGTGLVEFALSDIRDRGMTVVPQCAMVAAYVEEHPETQDLVEKA